MLVAARMQFGCTVEIDGMQLDHFLNSLLRTEQSWNRMDVHADTDRGKLDIHIEYGANYSPEAPAIAAQMKTLTGTYFPDKPSMSASSASNVPLHAGPTLTSDEVSDVPLSPLSTAPVGISASILAFLIFIECGFTLFRLDKSLGIALNGMNDGVLTFRAIMHNPHSAFFYQKIVYWLGAFITMCMLSMLRFAILPLLAVTIPTLALIQHNPQDPVRSRVLTLCYSYVFRLAIYVGFFFLGSYIFQKMPPQLEIFKTSGYPAILIFVFIMEYYGKITTKMLYALQMRSPSARGLLALIVLFLVNFVPPYFHR